MNRITWLTLGSIIALIFIPFSLSFSQSFNFPVGIPIFDFPTNTTPESESLISPTAPIPTLPAIIITPPPIPVSRIDENTGLPQGVSEQIDVTLTPQYPKPGEEVLVSLKSFSSDLHKARIKWYENGTLISDGPGIVKRSILLPNTTEETVIRIEIEKDTGGTIDHVITIAPASVDLVYEALTYTPPFYKGRKLFSHQSALKVVAIPQFNDGGTTFDPDELAYKWEKNGNVIQEFSGIGQQTLILQSDLIPRPVTVTVTVTAPGSNLKAREIMKIALYEPDVVLYENNPVLGTIMNRSLDGGNYELDRDEIEVMAVPFYFSAENSIDLNYIWSLNGRKIATDEHSDSLTLRNEANISGQSNIRARIEHNEHLLQRSQSTVNIFIPSGSASSNDSEEAFNF